jgi:hypothetical protein
MGAAASVTASGGVSADDHNDASASAAYLANSSSRIDEARTYFGNDILMRGFWAPIDQDGGGSVTLTGIRNYLRNTNPENVVAIYAGPFLGPFATSSFCLKQAYWTCTGRVAESDPDTMELQDHEFKTMLQYLFFFHNLYSLFGESCVHSEPISLEDFTEAVLDLLDESSSKAAIKSDYERLGKAPTFGAYVASMSERYLRDVDTRAAQFEDSIKPRRKSGVSSAPSKDHAEGNRTRGNSFAGSHAGSDHMGSTAHESITCVRYPCRDVDAWIKQIQELGVVPFKAIIDDIAVSRVVIAQDMHDAEKCVMFLWHVDNGEGYQDFESENMSEGGVFVQAAEEGIISLPFESVGFNHLTHDGWAARIRPGDALDLSHFNTKSHIGFADSLQEDIDTLGRSSGALQNFVGKLITAKGAGGAILSHFTSKAWADVGEKGSKAFLAEPPEKYMVSGPVHKISCRVKATYEVFTWLVDAPPPPSVIR